LRRVEFDDDPFAVDVILQRSPYLVNYLVKVQRGLGRSGLLEQGADAPDHLCSGIPIANNAVDRDLGPRDVGRVARQPTMTSLGVGNDCCQRLVNLMRDRRGQLCDGRNLRRARKLGLRGSQFVFCFPAFVDVDREAIKTAAAIDRATHVRSWRNLAFRRASASDPFRPGERSDERRGWIMLAKMSSSRPPVVGPKRRAARRHRRSCLAFDMFEA
jgi:hypothetical protein